MAQMLVWTAHASEHVRRLASEGCRPLLPWGQVLTSFMKDPAPVLRILERLKSAPSLYVRKSVAQQYQKALSRSPFSDAHCNRRGVGYVGF